MALAIDAESCYRRYGPMVLRRCRHLLGDEDRAIDAMQDVFVQLLVHRERLEDKGLSSLLYRIATNVCLNRLRSRRRRPEDPDAELLNRIASMDVDTDRRADARSVLTRLFKREQESTRTIAVLHLLDGMTLEEVAGEVGLSVSGVRKRLRGLRAQLHAMEGP
jgi:RNA polymerase sigma-70 factor (ECF subfamily)